MKIIIRAGGSGTRLWPASREENPKQFQAILNEKSLIRNTVDRIRPFLGGGKDFFVSVNKKMIKKLKKEIPEIPSKNVIVESAGRNTGPAICLESCFLARRFGEDVVVASLPSDDYVADEAAFRKMLRAAEKFLEKNPEYIITPGVRSTCLDAGYSYIKIGERLAGGEKTKIFKAASWVEKPSPSRCGKLIRLGKYFSHTGMYVWKLKTVLDLFRKFQPKMYEVCRLAAAGQGDGNYVKLEKITVESAITARASKIAVITASDSLGWSDLGKWQIVAKMLSSDKNGNVTKGKIVPIDTKNCLIYGPDDKLISTIGLDNLIIVLTEDALLVCPKDRAAEVKKIVEELEKKRLKKFL